MHNAGLKLLQTFMFNQLFDSYVLNSKVIEIP